MSFFKICVNSLPVRCRKTNKQDIITRQTEYHTMCKIHNSVSRGLQNKY